MVDAVGSCNLVACPHGLEDKGNAVDRRSCLGNILRYDVPESRVGPRLQTSLRARRSRHDARKRRLRLFSDAA
jgi:hypothetical protein